MNAKSIPIAVALIVFATCGAEASDIPAITVFLPRIMTANTPAMIVCPGGGYVNLAMTASTRFDGGDAGAADSANRANSRPDFTVLGYPVISMTEAWTHQGSKKPTFLFHTNADTAVPAENSVHYYLALRRAGVPAEMHIFERGPYGVGLANDDAALSEWSKLLANWLRVHGVVASTANAQQPGPPPPGAPAPAAVPAGRGGAQALQLVSPQVLPDRRIVFRILAPQAQNVRITGTDIPSLAGGGGRARDATDSSVMRKAENGVWDVTVGPVPPGSYRYNFNVDGVPVIDPRNPATSESNTNTWSLVHVPGAEFMDTQQVPRGGVTAVTYYSTALGRFRRMHVYTPPGYERGGNRFPVFYLLHGAGDSDASWSSVGRAGFILDNLIAAKKAKPMVVVMTAGHTNPPAAAAVSGAPPRDEFADDFINDVMPYIEKNYRVLTDRPNRGMAGLSMGGSQTLNIAFRHLDKFAYVGVFSSGAGLGGGQITDWESAHKTGLGDASLRKGLRLLWVSTGVDDFVLPNSKNTVEMLKRNGFSPVFKESAGGHTWLNWRDYLNEFAPQLFQ